MTSEHLSIQVENGDEEERESSTDAITSLDGAENVREEVQEEVQEEVISLYCYRRLTFVNCYTYTEMILI